MKGVTRASITEIVVYVVTDVQSHMRTHTKSEPYLCQLWNHKATGKDFLQKHINQPNLILDVDLEQVESMNPGMYHIIESVERSWRRKRVSNYYSWEQIKFPEKLCFEDKTNKFFWRKYLENIHLLHISTVRLHILSLWNLHLIQDFWQSDS